MIGCEGDNVGKEYSHMDDNNLLACEDFFLLLAVKSAAKNKYRNYEYNCGQEFIRCVEVLHLIHSFYVFVSTKSEHATCPGCYLYVKVSINCV